MLLHDLPPAKAVCDFEVNEGMLWMDDAEREKPNNVVDGLVPELVTGREEMM
ncbi:MAG: hypothetical protein KJ065_07125 [Anaerolineae bacterium]|nr:hypothetical protein [Anaerolineae bacterium]